jgi:hypothetical protein
MQCFCSFGPIISEKKILTYQANTGDNGCKVMILTHMHECETDLWYNLDVYCNCLNGYCHYIEEICLESVLDFNSKDCFQTCLS